MNHSRTLTVGLALILIASPAATASPLSSGLQTAIRYIEKRVLRQTTNQAADQIAKHIAGKDAVLAERLAKTMAGKSEAEIKEFSSWFRQAKELRGLTPIQKEAAVDFLWRNRREGALVIKRFGWPDVVKYGIHKQGAEGVVKETGKLIEPGMDHSWKALQQALTKAGMNGGEREFAEKLFLDRARAGRISGLEKVELFEGQHNGKHGIDLIGITPEGRIKIIEFSTSTKPSNTAQMSWPWIEANMKKFLSSATLDRKINLKNAGFPAEWVEKPQLITEKGLRKLVDPEFYAVGRNDRLLRELDKGIKFCLIEPPMACRYAKAA